MASYVSYILVSNKRKRKKKTKNIVQTGISLTQTEHPVSHSRGHSYTFTKIFTSRTILLIFFVVFVFI